MREAAGQVWEVNRAVIGAKVFSLGSSVDLLLFLPSGVCADVGIAPSFPTWASGVFLLHAAAFQFLPLVKGVRISKPFSQGLLIP